MESRFRQFRVIKRVPQEFLEAKTGISQTTISLIENGHRAATDVEKKALARALKVPVADLFPEPLASKSDSLLTGGEGKCQ